MLCDTLDRLIHAERTSVTEVAELAGVSNSTVYRWLSKRSHPDFDAMRRVIRGLKNPEAQEAMLTVLISGTRWQLRRNDMPLDVNRDGRIDTEDALDAAIRVVKSAGQSLVDVRAARATGVVKKDHLVDLVGELNAVVQHSTLVQQVLIRLVEEQGNRKRAKPVVV
ncbi:MAG: helix-turn-helix domain-containing protein [Phycisphaeraceae bacterium]